MAYYECEYEALSFDNLMRIADACNYEILFKDKDRNRIYRFNDMNLAYDIRVATKEKI